MTGMIPMTFMLLERIVEEVVFVMVDILIVFPIYRIVTVFAKFNNEENLSEYLNVQLTEENAYADSNFNSIELNKKNDKVKIEI
ncbi:hypothetical protein FACS189459_2560 [Bacilli bacterium]|nr:hypothetical protein FACS189459_2560 [Bacilli bacterium]